MLHRHHKIVFLLVLFLAASLGGQALANDLSLCLEIYTRIEAGGDASDKELAAAAQACARLQQTTQTSDATRKTAAAAVAIAEEQQRRHH